MCAAFENEFYGGASITYAFHPLEVLVAPTVMTTYQSVLVVACALTKQV